MEITDMHHDEGDDSTTPSCRRHLKWLLGEQLLACGGAACAIKQQVTCCTVGKQTAESIGDSGPRQALGHFGCRWKYGKTL